MGSTPFAIASRPHRSRSARPSAISRKVSVIAQSQTSLRLGIEQVRMVPLRRQLNRLAGLELVAGIEGRNQTLATGLDDHLCS